MLSQARKKMILVGIAGTPTDLLLSVHSLKCHVCQNDRIAENLDIVVRHYPAIASEDTQSRAAQIAEDVEKEKPDVAGFSCYVWNIDAVNLILQRLNREREDIAIVLGGPEIASEDIEAGKLRHLKADFLVHGEGERPLEAVLEHLLGLSDQKLDQVEGLAYRNGDSFACNSGANLLGDLAHVPSPYLTGHISDEILSMPDVRINIETQRGCNFRCAYCLYHKNFSKIRYRDPETVVREMEYAFGKGVKAARIVDANFLSNKEVAGHILRGLIARRIEMGLFVEILPQFLDEELARLFGEYRRLSPVNRFMVGIGIQTLTQESLAVIRRKIPVRHFENAFALLQREDILIKSDLILGLPRETKQSYFATMEFMAEKMRHGTNYFSLALLRILPGSDLVRIAREENLTIDSRDTSHFVYETPTMPREDMLECQRLNAAAFRLLSATDLEERKRLRDLFFEVKDALEVTNVQILTHFADQFSVLLKDKDVDYVKPDFPNPETYTSRYAYEQIPDRWLIEQLQSLRSGGLACKQDGAAPSQVFPRVVA
jgi:radical SAM superfamily enzyme YgiQ (UPF0313 family)